MRPVRRLREALFVLDARQRLFLAGNPSKIDHRAGKVDVRFRTGRVHKSVGNLLKFEMGAEGVGFNEITDYSLLLVYLMAKLGFTKTECKQLLQGYREIVEKYRAALPYNIYSQFIGTQTRSKLDAANDFIRSL